MAATNDLQAVLNEQLDSKQILEEPLRNRFVCLWLSPDSCQAGICSLQFQASNSTANTVAKKCQVVERTRRTKGDTASKTLYLGTYTLPLEPGLSLRFKHFMFLKRSLVSG